MSTTETTPEVGTSPEVAEMETRPARAADPFAEWFDRLPDWFHTPFSDRMMDRMMDRRWRDLFHDAPLTRLETERTDDTYVVRAEIPGVSIDDVHIDVDGRMLTIRTTRERRTESEEGERRSEFHYGSSERTITLPVAARTGDARAIARDGILEITFPLDPERPTATKIPIEER